MLAAEDPSVGHFVVREAGFHISPRERPAVEEWIKSGVFPPPLSSLSLALYPYLSLARYLSLSCSMSPSLSLSIALSPALSCRGVDQVGGAPPTPSRETEGERVRERVVLNPLSRSLAISFDKSLSLPLCLTLSLS